MTQQTVKVGNSIQQQQQPLNTETQIQQHSIQEKPYVDKDEIELPDLNVYMKRENLDKLYNKIYEIVSDLNKKYKLDEDSLEILKNQGFIAFVQDLKQDPDKEGLITLNQVLKQDTDKEGLNLMPRESLIEIGQQQLFILIQNAVMSAITADPWMLLAGAIQGVSYLIYQIVQLTKQSQSTVSVEEGQEIIDEWLRQKQKTHFNLQTNKGQNIDLFFE